MIGILQDFRRGNGSPKQCNGTYLCHLPVISVIPLVLRGVGSFYCIIDNNALLAIDLSHLKNPVSGH